MRYIIEKETALRIFYYFMAIDGEVTDDEIIKFKEIAQEIDGEKYKEYSDQLIRECDEQISTVGAGDEVYDVIQESVDQMIHMQADTCTDGLSRRLLIWNLYALSFSDGYLAEEEKRFIAHLGRILDVEKSVLLEMEQLVQTAMVVMNELSVLNESNRPYSEIKPLVDEIEHRKNVLIKIAQNLIADDYFELTVTKEKNKRLLDIGKKLNDTILPVSAAAGEKAQKTLKEMKSVIGERTSKGIHGLKAGSEKLAKKFGKS